MILSPMFSSSNFPLASRLQYYKQQQVETAQCNCKLRILFGHNLSLVLSRINTIKYYLLSTKTSLCKQNKKTHCFVYLQARPCPITSQAAGFFREIIFLYLPLSTGQITLRMPNVYTSSQKFDTISISVIRDITKM